MYIALKPCQIAGKKYIIDDKVDVSMLTEQEIASLCKKKLIVKAGAEDNVFSASLEETLLTVPVVTKDETIEVTVTGEQLRDVVALVQKTAEIAIKDIKEITEEAMLILIHRLDSRKSVQEAAQKRAEALAKAKEEANENASNGEGENENEDGEGATNPNSGENDPSASTGNGDDE